MDFYNQLNRNASLPATIITPPGPVGVELDVRVIGANGPTGSSAPKIDNDSDCDLPDIPFTFEQEQNLLLKMNDEQSTTIDYLQKRLLELEKQLRERPVPPICYIRCSHCQEEEKDSKK
jgi:hypothetical protein